MKFKQVTRSLILSVIMLAGVTASAGDTIESGITFGGSLGLQSIYNLEPVLDINFRTPAYSMLVNDGTDSAYYERSLRWFGTVAVGYIWDNGMAVNVEGGYGPLSTIEGEDYYFKATGKSVFVNFDYHGLAGKFFDWNSGFFASIGVGRYKIDDGVIRSQIQGLDMNPDYISCSGIICADYAYPYFFEGTISADGCEDWAWALKLKGGWEWLLGDNLLFGANFVITGIDDVPAFEKMTGIGIFRARTVDMLSDLKVEDYSGIGSIDIGMKQMITLGGELKLTFVI